jgi:shikimate kinase
MISYNFQQYVSDTKKLKNSEGFFFGGGGRRGEAVVFTGGGCWIYQQQADRLPSASIVVYGTAEAPHSPSRLSAKKAGNLKFPRFYSLCVGVG